MGLRVWLPLNGSLENQGLSTLSITNSSATVDTAGKIGSCYSFNGSSAYMRTAYPAANYVTKPFSVAFWVYFNNVTANACICSNRTSVGYGFAIFKISNYLRFDNGTNSAQSLCEFTNYTFTASKWYHVVCIQKATSRELYVDGVLRQTANYAPPASNTAQYLLIGASSNADSTPTANYLNGKLNDFRLYDHALSVKEVRELARGLMVHYKLDSPDIEAATNYLTAAQSCATSTRLTYSEWVASLSPATCTCGNYVITYSAYIRNTSSVRSAVRCSPIKVGSGYDTFIGNYLAPGEEGWSSITCDLTDTTKYTGQVYCYFANGSSGSVPEEKYIWVKHVQIERNNHQTEWTLGGTTRSASTRITDSSGFKRHGTVSSTLQPLSNTPRYNHSTYFATTASKITLPVINFSGTSTTYTFAWWQYMVNTARMAWGFGNGNRLNVYYGNPICWNTGDGTSTPFQNGTTTINPSELLNAWHHIAVTGDGAAAKIYIDGVYRGTAKTWRAITGTQIYISGWDTGTSYSWSGGKLSDFRIYSTTLTANDIHDLYATSAEVDRNGNYYSREVIEK